MENVEIARILNSYADLLEIQGEGLFRVFGLSKRFRVRRVGCMSRWR